MAEAKQCSILDEPSKKRIKLDLVCSLEQKEIPEKKKKTPEFFTFSVEHITASAKNILF
jgi:hypothetical protein